MFPAQSQDKPANNMEILRDKIKADKKLLVATNMELTRPLLTRTAALIKGGYGDAGRNSRCFG